MMCYDESDETYWHFYRPHSDALSCVAVACTTPSWTAWPSVRLFIADSAMLNPLPAVSMAVIVMLVPLKESCQQVPQLAELNPAIA